MMNQTFFKILFQSGLLALVHAQCLPKDEVTCFMDPCQLAVCKNYPSAECRSNYCGGCNAEFFYEGEKLTSLQCSDEDHNAHPHGQKPTFADCLGLSCEDCLNAGCVQSPPGRCSAECAMDVGCFKGDALSVCEEVNSQLLLDEQCSTQRTCSSCASQELADGSSCAWFGSYCSHGCGMHGCDDAILRVSQCNDGETECTCQSCCNQRTASECCSNHRFACDTCDFGAGTNSVSTSGGAVIQESSSSSSALSFAIAGSVLGFVGFAGATIAWMRQRKHRAGMQIIK